MPPAPDPRPAGSRLVPIALVVVGVLVTAGLVAVVLSLNDRSGESAEATRVTPSTAGSGELLRLDDCPATDPDADEVDGGLPALTLECLGAGDAVRLAGLTGQPSVINVWAQWCGPCEEELPYLQQAHEAFGDRVRLLGVDYQETSTPGALDLLEKSGVTYPQVADPEGSVRGPFSLPGLPMTVFADADGQVVYALTRPLESYDELAQLIEDKLGVAAPAP